jgi:prepilin-type N-terminal cleavage/methylation domain-containing protein
MIGANHNRGYTLLEIIVSIGIFSLVVLVAVSTFQSINEGQRSALASQNTQESMRYALEVMSKEMRSAKAKTPKCGGNTSNKVFNMNTAQDNLYFQNKNNECVRYYLSNNQLYIDRNGTPLSITPDEIRVSELKFSVKDDAIATFHTVQPTVTMAMKVEMAKTSQMHKNEIYLQTTISSRHYE